jgi:hypothetical protein
MVRSNVVFPVVVNGVFKLPELSFLRLRWLLEPIVPMVSRWAWRYWRHHLDDLDYALSTGSPPRCSKRRCKKCRYRDRELTAGASQVNNGRFEGEVERAR